MRERFKDDVAKVESLKASSKFKDLLKVAT